MILNNTYMITSDIKIAVRNILRNKVQSLISILGLGIGLGSIILLLCLIVHENSFDRFIPEYQNVYRINFGQSTGTQYPLAEEMKKDFPEVRDFFRITQADFIQVRNLKNEFAKDQKFAFSDSSIFKILGIKILAGTPANNLTEVAISEKMAKKFFGKSSALGEILRVKLNTEFISLTVSGIYKDLPPNSTLYPDFLANIKLSEKMFAIAGTSYGQYGEVMSAALNWDLPYFYTYVVLDKNTDKKALVSKMLKYRDLIHEESYKKWEYQLQPVD